MLIFKGSKDLESYSFRYNSKEMTVVAGQKVDVRDFDVPNAGVRGTEKHIMSKHPGLFELTDEKNDGVVSKEAQKEIKELKSLVSEKDSELKKTKDALDNISEKHAASVGEIEAAKQETASIKKEIKKLEKKNADLEEEVEKLRLQVGTKK